MAFFFFHLVETFFHGGEKFLKSAAFSVEFVTTFCGASPSIAVPRRWRSNAAFSPRRRGRHFAFRSLLRYDSRAFVDEIGVISPIFQQRTVSNFKDPRGESVEKVTIMGDDEQGSSVLQKRFLEKLLRCHVQVIGRLVENEQICVEQE